MAIIEERYSFFQIENKLRQICNDACNQLNRRLQGEAELLRKVQQQCEAAKRDVSGLEPRIERALQANVAIQGCFKELGSLEVKLKQAEERA